MGRRDRSELLPTSSTSRSEREHHHHHKSSSICSRKRIVLGVITAALCLLLLSVLSSFFAIPFLSFSSSHTTSLQRQLEECNVQSGRTQKLVEEGRSCLANELRRQEETKKLNAQIEAAQKEIAQMNTQLNQCTDSLSKNLNSDKSVEAQLAALQKEHAVLQTRSKNQAAELAVYRKAKKDKEKADKEKQQQQEDSKPSGSLSTEASVSKSGPESNGPLPPTTLPSGPAVGFSNKKVQLKKITTTNQKGTADA